MKRETIGFGLAALGGILIIVSTAWTIFVLLPSVADWRAEFPELLEDISDEELVEWVDTMRKVLAVVMVCGFAVEAGAVVAYFKGRAQLGGMISVVAGAITLFGAGGGLLGIVGAVLSVIGGGLLISKK